MFAIRIVIVSEPQQLAESGVLDAVTVLTSILSFHGTSNNWNKEIFCCADLLPLLTGIPLLFLTLDKLLSSGWYQPPFW